MEITKNVKTNDSVFVSTLKTNKGEKNIVWVSDIHGDSTHSNHKFLDKIIHKYPGCLLIIGGDHLDVMQNFGDKRASKSSLDVRFKEDDYLNEIIDFNVERWGKYAKRIIAFFVGNHEMTQVKFHGIDLTREIVKNLNQKYDANILCGDVAGWLKLRFDDGGRYFTKNIYFAHRPISGGSRSKGMLSVDIIKGQYPDADIFISEHIHNTWMKPERVERLSNEGTLRYDTKWVLQMPTLKDEYIGRKRGYVHDRNFGANPIGLIVLQFQVSHSGVQFSPKYELVL